jgi:hypothetical protein
MRNVLVLQVAERRKQLPCSGTVAALTIYIRHDLLLLLNVTATDSDVLLGIIKVRLLHRAVHAVLPLFSNPSSAVTKAWEKCRAPQASQVPVSERNGRFLSRYCNCWSKQMIGIAPIIMFA